MASTDLNLSGYKLTFDDEFNNFSWRGNGGIWDTKFHYGGRSLPSNGEQQFYSDSSVGVNPFKVGGGALDITVAPSTNTGASGGLPYTSGLITTEGVFSQEYGYFEMRAKLPEGKGMWPAFWMLPQDKTWPPELDALEGFGATNSRGEGGADKYHIGAVSSSNGFGTWVNLPAGTNIYNGYHTYGIKWDADHLTYYFDGQQIGQTATPADAHKAMYMLANTAVGGGWAEAPNGETAHMDIDYIRAYSNDPNAHAVALNGMSSPDGANTSTMYGAAAANITGTVTTPSAPVTPVTPANPTTTVKLHVSGDQYQGTPHFDVVVDGFTVASQKTTGAVHGQGQWSDVTASSNYFASTPHKVYVHFTDDAYGGTASTDKNLYVDYIEVNGKRYEGETAKDAAASGHEALDPHAAVMASNGWLTFDLDAKAAGASAPVTGKSIVGSNASETLQGTAGADILTGIGGSDKLSGGAGADIFMFNNAASHDNVITDFTAGFDKLWVKGAMKGYSGSHPFLDHVLTISDSAAGAVITFDPDGNGAQAGHTLVTLEHVHAAQLKASDFIWH